MKNWKNEIRLWLLRKLNGIPCEQAEKRVIKVHEHNLTPLRCHCAVDLKNKSQFAATIEVKDTLARSFADYIRSNPECPIRRVYDEYKYVSDPTIGEFELVVYFDIDGCELNDL